MNKKTKLYIVSSHFNNTGYIRLQHYTFKKYFKEDYEYIVFNDAREDKTYTNYYNDKLGEDIFNCCVELGIKCIRIPQDIHINRRLILPNTQEPFTHNACTRCADCLQYMTHYMLNYLEGKNEFENYLFIIDSDIFMTKELDIKTHLGEHLAEGCDIQTRLSHGLLSFWSAYAIFNVSKCPNLHEICWDCGSVNNIGVDVGGQTYAYINKYNDILKYKHVNIRSFNGRDTITNCDINIDVKLKEYLLNICKIFKYSLDTTHRGNTECRKDVFMDNDMNVTFLHLKSGGNYDGAHHSIKQLEFLYTFNYLQGIDNYDDMQNKCIDYLKTQSQVKEFKRAELKHIAEIKKLKNDFAYEPQSYDKFIILKNRLHKKVTRVLLLYPCNFSENNEKEISEYIYTHKDEILVICVDECIQKYISYCDIAIFHGISKDTCLLNLNNIITIAYHDEYTEHEFEADINMIGGRNTSEKYDATRFFNHKISDEFHMEDKPRMFKNESRDEIYSYMQTVITGPCRQNLWMFTRVSGDILFNVALRLCSLIEVPVIAFPLMDKIVLKNV